MKKASSILIVCLVVSSMFLIFTTSSASSEADNGFRRMIEVDNSANPENLTDYQVFINVTFNFNMQPDFDDLRFTWYNETSDQEVSIDYWIDKYIVSEYALLWVEIPSIRGLSQETLYMYYGDPIATSASNGEETFVFFDDFSTNTTSNYEFVKETLYPWADGIVAWNSEEELMELTDNDPDEIANGRGSYVWVRQKFELMNVYDDSYLVETRGQINGSPRPDMFNVFHFYDYTGDHSTSNGFYSLRACLREGIQPLSTNFQIHNRWGQGIWEFYDSEPVSWLKDTWYRWSLGTLSNGTVVARLYDDTYGIIAVLDNVTAHQSVDWWVGVGHGAGEDYGLTSRYDYIRVRKFTDPEPSCAIGEEEPLSLIAPVDIDPDTLNLGSSGNWVTCYIELPEGEAVENIDVSTIMLNDTIPVDLEAPTMIGDKDADSVPDLMIKFDRHTVIVLILQNCELGDKHGTVTLTVTGRLDDETPFMGSDTIKVKVPTGKNSKYIAP